jgi:transposase
MGDGSWVGIDVHARSAVAGVINDGTGEVRVQAAPHESRELVAWLQALAPPVRVAYEAGPTGYGLARACAEAGISCLVAAPGLIPRASGSRRKSDRRDAEHLARLLRNGDLVAVRVPAAGQEAARDLVRAREDARADLMRARHRLSKLLLRNGMVYPARAWTGQHDAWLRRQRLPEAAARAAFADYYGAVAACGARRDALDEAIAELACEPPWAATVGRLRTLRGVGTLTAFALCVEIGDWRRLRGGTIGAYLGLVPSEYQSGSHLSRGAISKCGNSHARRLLVESAWHQRTARLSSPELERRRAGQRDDVVMRARAAERRLHRRWRHLAERRKLRPTVVAVAVARELAGWCWSLAVMDD